MVKIALIFRAPGKRVMEEIRGGLMAQLAGRRGMMCCVLRGGTRKQGGEIRLE